ncbi:MAG: S1/P1 nuclease [Lunatimonas sp.]|uniref:S1/P1 nuclease n=1 Tax=Lunatimonas sp. TaxID=2060141 RepID=UPI00263BB687|nr:S1/P1 nuclease [Lunatimonas sp.]MCC5937428.1 S1/P1 nuclease [Lunatimonas sp.]
MPTLKKWFFLLLISQLSVIDSWGWGQTGHRVVGQLAEWHLNKKAKKRIDALLGSESLAMVANWMDNVKSDRRYDHLNTWHYLSIEDGKAYNPAIQEKEGDAYEKTKMIIQVLKKGGLSAKEESEYLKMLVHLVGDLHQPLHVGRGDDRGGNDIRVTYFNQNSNIHRVWDSQIIDGKQLSYTELSEHLNRRAEPSIIQRYQKASIEDWLQEAVALRPIVYDLPEDGRLSYEYDYVAFPVIEERLLAGGLRLAGILNDIYGR